jgi:outer membrane protein TolC
MVIATRVRSLRRSAALLLTLAGTAALAQNPASAASMAHAASVSAAVDSQPPQRTSAVLFADAASGQENAGSTQSAQTPPSGQPPTVTLQDALERAKINSATFRAAVTDRGLARQDIVQARAALLPGVSYATSYLYTQGNGSPSGRFIANNGVHEYLAQGNAHQTLGLTPIADFQRVTAAEALAKAKLEIATRGLVVTVVDSYYNLVVSARKRANTQSAYDEAQQFLDLSRMLERGGEVAHSDVIKAQLQANDRQLSLQEAQLAEQKARLGLAVLLFPNFSQDFTVVDDLRFAPPLPLFAEAQQLAEKNNVDLKAAALALKVASHEVTAAFGAHLPSLTLDYWYGIDANHFAVSSFGIRNLGYAAQATLNVPVFNWGALQSKVKQAELRRAFAQVELTEAQRVAVANLNGFYAEAATARSELDQLRESAELAAESLRLTNLRYKAGEATALEVVDAQNSLILSRNAYDDGEARYRMAIARLQTLTGSF